MSLALTILKFAAILVSAALGIMGTLTETRDKDTQRITSWGWRVVGLTVAGLVVAIGLQIFDSVRQQRENEETRKKTREISIQLEQQTGLANQARTGIAHIETSLSETLSIDAIYEFPRETGVVELDKTRILLESYLEHGRAHSGRNFILKIFPEDLFSADTAKRLRPRLPMPFLVEIQLQHSNRDNHSAPKFQNAEYVLDSLIDAEFRISFSYPDSSPVLSISSEQYGDKDVFLYHTDDYKRVFLRWHYRFPQNDWKIRGKISLQEIALTHCRVTLSSFPGPLRMKPIAMEIRFDRYPPVTVDQFTVDIRDSKGAGSFLLPLVIATQITTEAIIPSVEDILNGNEQNTYLRVLKLKLWGK